MSEKKKSLLPKFEIIIILVFFFSFLIWASSRCGDIRRAATEKIEENTSQEVNTDSLVANVGTDTVYITRRDSISSQKERIYARLYITINNLKVRTEPDLKADVLGQLSLFDEVTFLNEVTDSTYQINLGYETANEPWVKIRTKRGTEGWVYGAGVNYYKKKRSGVLE